MQADSVLRCTEAHTSPGDSYDSLRKSVFIHPLTVGIPWNSNEVPEVRLPNRGTYFQDHD